MGAGAESSYGIANGEKFAMATVGINSSDYNVNEMNKAIKKHYNEKINQLSKQLKSWYPEEHRNCSLELEQLINAAALDYLVEHGRTIQNKKQIKNEIKEIKFKKNNIDLLKKNLSYKGIFDKDFYSIIAPASYGLSSFWKVVNMYNRAYLCIMKDILTKKDKYKVTSKGEWKFYYEILNAPIEKINEMMAICRDLLMDEKKYEVNYQYALMQVKDADLAIVTTNYTPFSELCVGRDKTAYVNGKLGWFESAYQLNAYDLLDENEITYFRKNCDLYFPYIFTQSATKPIVEEKMIREYSKASDFIRDADEIIVLGYRINSDDNHINSLIRKAVISGKKVIYLAYKGESQLMEADIRRRLHLDKIGRDCQNLIWESFNGNVEELMKFVV